MGHIPSSMIIDDKGELSNFPNFNQSGHIENVLLELIDEMPYAISLKDVRTGKYTHNNSLYAKRLGLKNNDSVIGLTANDLEMYKKWDFSFPFRQWKTNDLDYIRKSDYEVKTTIHKHISLHIFFTSDGFIGFDKNIKLPVPSSDNRKVIAILTCSYDITIQFGLFKLFRLYQKYYSDTHAIKLLLIYLKIEDGFKNLPTIKEMHLLFALYHEPSGKRAAQFLNIP